MAERFRQWWANSCQGRCQPVVAWGVLGCVRASLGATDAVGGGAVVDEQPLPAGRDAALTALFVSHHRSLVGLAALLVDDLGTAEDVVQDAFLGLYRRWAWIREHEAAYDYLRTAVLNGARSQLRRRRVQRTKTAPESPNEPSAESTVIVHEEHAAVLAELAGLALRQRQVLVLRYYLDQTEAEIARTLSISPGSVKQHASRGLAALTARLEATP
jgi:RNA polymerase sigma-70 factor (sigma-E family)